MQLRDLSSQSARIEAIILRALEDRIIAAAPRLRRVAQAIDDLDIALGFAQISSELQYVRPLVDSRSSALVRRTDNRSFDLVIRDGRHPTVEVNLLQSSEHFEPNSTSMQGDDARVHVITGPNMCAGAVRAC